MKLEIGKKYKLACGFMAIIKGFDGAMAYGEYLSSDIGGVPAQGWIAAVWSQLDGRENFHNASLKIIGEWPGP